MLDDNGFTAHSLALLVLLQEYCRGLFTDSPDDSQVGTNNQQFIHFTVYINYETE